MGRVPLTPLHFAAPSSHWRMGHRGRSRARGHRRPLKFFALCVAGGISYLEGNAKANRTPREAHDGFPDAAAHRPATPACALPSLSPAPRLRTSACSTVWGGGPRNNQHNPRYADYWVLLTHKRHIPPHPAQPQHTSHWAARTRKRHQQEHRPQRPTERGDPTQHAKGRTGDCPGPRNETITGRNVTQGGGGYVMRLPKKCEKVFFLACNLLQLHLLLFHGATQWHFTCGRVLLRHPLWRPDGLHPRRLQTTSGVLRQNPLRTSTQKPPWMDSGGKAPARGLLLLLAASCCQRLSTAAWSR